MLNFNLLQKISGCIVNEGKPPKVICTCGIALCILFFINCRLLAITAVEPSTGDGTSDHPYQIATLQNLYWIAQNSQYWGSSFIQTASIDASETASWDDGDGGEIEGWTPIGNTTDKFHGSYDGQNYSISGLTINRPSTANVGLFGHVGHVESDTEATIIRRLRLTDVSVIGARGSGTLIGRVTGNANTRIEACYALNGQVRGDGATGGLIGSHNSYRDTPGGTDNPVASQCHADIDVIFSGQGGADKFGGLAGCSQKGTISNCFARGSITVTNATRIGGLAGCIEYRGRLVHSYATGEVQPINCTLDGGLVGNLGPGGNAGIVTDCFWDTETSGMTTSAGGIGKTTAQMKTESTFTSVNWEFPEIWGIDGNRNDGYPFLSAFLTLPVENKGCAIGAVSLSSGTADSYVPVEWNIGPLREGVWREDFENTAPPWISTTGKSLVTNTYPSVTFPEFPARTNSWFDSGTQALLLDVPAGVLSNRLAYTASDGGGPVLFSTLPLYIDFLAFFEPCPADRTPSDLLKDWMLGVTLDTQHYLVAVDGSGSTVSTSTFETGVWHRVTLRLENENYSVSIDGTNVFTSLNLRNFSTAQIQALCFRGSGWIDEIFIGHCSPDYPVPGPTQSVPPIPISASNPPTDEQRTSLNFWLQNYTGINIQPDTTFNMTGDQLNDCYLIGELTGNAETLLPVSYTFGISAIDLHTPLLLKITARLFTDNGVKTGAINGYIRVTGKINRSDTEWQIFPEAITPEKAHFTNGHATYLYSIPEGGYRFFRAQIIPYL
ncbi:MAG: hypothetical protein R6V06_00805 [Kiritimatiellia bacterium]